jgi:cold shock CspA family protein
MKLTGKVIKFDHERRTGIIEESNGQQHLIANGSFRRTVRIKEGDRVSFTSQNLYAGPTAWEVVPEHSPNMNSVHVPHLPAQKFVRSH